MLIKGQSHERDGGGGGCGRGGGGGGNSGGVDSKFCDPSDSDDCDNPSGRSCSALMTSLIPFKTSFLATGFFKFLKTRLTLAGLLLAGSYSMYRAILATGIFLSFARIDLGVLRLVLLLNIDGKSRITILQAVSLPAKGSISSRAAIVSNSLSSRLVNVLFSMMRCWWSWWCCCCWCCL